MQEKIAFEKFLFGDGKEIGIEDMDFCVNRIIMLIRIRPHHLEKAVKLSIEYSKFADFRRNLLEKSNECPVVINRLFKKRVFIFEEIEPFLRNDNTFLGCYYFRKEIDDFESIIRTKKRPRDYDESFFENENDLDQLIEYGYHPSSIEYCLKYDVIDDLLKMNNLNRNAKRSPFEWSIQPADLDLLSFSGFFGSIKCFKHLLMKEFDINDKVRSMIVCSGCFDLFHLCQGTLFVTPNLFCNASEFFHLPLLTFMIENGVEINATNADIEQ